MQRKINSINSKDTVVLLDKQKELGLPDDAFRSYHHLGDSLEGFGRYCLGVESFRIGGSNHQLHQILEKIR